MSTSLQQPISLRTADAAPGDTEVAQLVQQLQQGQLEGLRQYLSRSRAGSDWQDRLYVLEQAAPKSSIDILNAACTAEPQAADLFLIRCAYYAELSKTMRGTGTADKVGNARFQNSAACVKAALTDMARCAQLDAADPTPFALLLAPLTIFSQHELQQKAFQKATSLAPDLVPAHRAITNSLSKRWGGSHEASVDFARKALAKAGPGSDIPTCLFWAHSLVRSHYESFDKDTRAARLYGQNPAVVQELNDALDRWIAPPYAARRSSMQYLRTASHWYRLTGDVERLKRVIAFTGEELKPPTSGPTTSSRQYESTSSSKNGGGVLGWIFGARR